MVLSVITFENIVTSRSGSKSPAASSNPKNLAKPVHQSTATKKYKEFDGEMPKVINDQNQIRPIKSLDMWHKNLMNFLNLMCSMSICAVD